MSTDDNAARCVPQPRDAASPIAGRSKAAIVGLEAAQPLQAEGEAVPGVRHGQCLLAGLNPGPQLVEED